MTAVERLKELVKKFERVQNSLSKFGAGDTEPDGVFQVMLVRAFKGKKPVVPDTADKWELYSDRPGVERAAKELADATGVCVRFIECVTLGEAGEVRKYLEDLCWRVDW